MIRNLLVLPTGEELFSGVVGENAITGVTVTRCVNSEEALTPGAVCASMLEASVIAQKPLPLTAGGEVTLYTVSGSGERKQEGIFIAEKPVWESANRYTLTAYDRVSMLDKDLTIWLGGLTGWPYCLLDFASMVCSECGLELISEEIPNGKYPVQQFSAEGITGRQLMQWVGQAAGRFCRATKDGQIEFAWYKETAENIGPEEKTVQTGPATVAILEGMMPNSQLQAVTQIAPSLSGTKAVTLKHSGKNLFDPQRMVVMKRAYFDEETGLWTVDTKKLAGTSAYHASLITTGTGLKGTRDVKGLIRVPPNTPVTIHINDWSAVTTDGSELEPGHLCIGYGWYYADGTCYNASNMYTGPTRTVISPNIEPCYLDIRRQSANVLVSFSSIQVELGSTATDYEPYRAETISRSFEENVYGGNLNWNTGVLTVTHGKIDSYAGEELPEGWISDTGQLSQGAQVVYALPEAYTVELAPRQIKALGGYDYLWSDTGDTEAGFHQEHYFMGSLSYEDYQTAPVEKVQIRLTEGDVGAIYPDDPEKTNTYILSGNYLLTNADAQALEAVAQNLLEELKNITYTPCKVEIAASAGVEAGDIVTVTDKNGKSITVYVMNRTVTGQRCKIECTGSPRRDSVTAVNEQTYKALAGKVLELRADIEGLRAEHRDARGDYSSLAVTVEGIAAEVSRQQTSEGNILQQMSQLQQTAQNVSVTVKSLQDNGVKKVQTEMGYTFDDRGLQISRKDEDISNLLDHSGMYVKNGQNTVLQANNDGVQAINITVHNYLTVGKHARFEAYSDGKRTACFFVGG